MKFSETFHHNIVLFDQIIDIQKKRWSCYDVIILHYSKSCIKTIRSSRNGVANCCVYNKTINWNILVYSIVSFLRGEWNYYFIRLKTTWWLNIIPFDFTVHWISWTFPATIISYDIWLSAIIDSIDSFHIWRFM